MATPLKTWQHSDPKSLWPVLGGLSVIAHIGLLGLSLPYVLELMQASNTSSAEAIPIELVVVSPTDKSLKTETEPLQAPPTKQQYSSSPSEPVQAALADDRTKPEAPTTEDIVTSETALPDEKETIAESPNTEDTPDTNNTTDTSQSSPAETENEAPNSGIDEQIEPEVNSSEADNSEADSSDSDRTLEPEPTVPTLPGEQTLPLPGEENSEPPISRPAALSIVDFREANGLQRDVGKTPPKPKEGTLADSIVLDSIAQGCGRLEFSQQQWTYRVAVRADGSVQQATVWTGGVAREISEEEGAIACLIESAGFEFEPALFEGQPILDDNLLITINVIEMPQ